MTRGAGATKAQKDKFIIEWMSHTDPARAYRNAGLAPNTKQRDGNLVTKGNAARDKRNGQALLRDPYVEGVLARFRAQQVEKFAEEADATRYEIMSGYRKVVEEGLDEHRAKGELSAVVRALDGMARMMGYFIEHKIIHHERSDKQIERMSTVEELQTLIRSLAVELGPTTIGLLMGEAGGDGGIIDITPEPVDRGASEAGEEASGSPAQ